MNALKDLFGDTNHMRDALPIRDEVSSDSDEPLR